MGTRIKLEDVPKAIEEFIPTMMDSQIENVIAQVVDVIADIRSVMEENEDDPDALVKWGEHVGAWERLLDQLEAKVENGGSRQVYHESVDRMLFYMSLALARYKRYSLEDLVDRASLVKRFLDDMPAVPAPIATYVTNYHRQIGNLLQDDVAPAVLRQAWSLVSMVDRNIGTSDVDTSDTRRFKRIFHNDFRILERWIAKQKANRDKATWFNRYVWRKNEVEETAQRESFGSLDDPQPVANPEIEEFYSRIRRDAKQIISMKTSYKQRKLALKDIAQIIGDLQALGVDSTTLALWRRAERVTKQLNRRYTGDGPGTGLGFHIYSAQQVIAALKRPTSSTLGREAVELLDLIEGRNSVTVEMRNAILAKKGDIKEALRDNLADEDLKAKWAGIYKRVKNVDIVDFRDPKVLLRIKTILFHVVTMGKQRPVTWKEWFVGLGEGEVWHSDDGVGSGPDDAGPHTIPRVDPGTPQERPTVPPSSEGHADLIARLEVLTGMVADVQKTVDKIVRKHV